MENPIYYIVYSSSAKNLYSDSELQQILTKSRINNSKTGITGILLYSEGNILQVLEGPKESVQSLYRFISTDPRHHQVSMMIEGHCSQRNFIDWSMGLKYISKKDWEKVNGHIHLSNESSIINRQKQEVEIYTLINSFLRIHLR